MTEKDTKKEMPENEAGIDVNADESVNDVADVSGTAENSSEIEKLKAELNESSDKYLRKVAEFENFKRRNARERIELIQTAGKEVIAEMLNVLDDCERAQKQLETSEDVKEIKEGVLLVFNKFRNVLQA